MDVYIQLDFMYQEPFCSNPVSFHSFVLVGDMSILQQDMCRTKKRNIRWGNGSNR